MKKILFVFLAIVMLTGLTLPVFAQEKDVVSINYNARDAVDSVLFYKFDNPDKLNWFAFSVTVYDIKKIDYIHVNVDYDKEMFDFLKVEFPAIGGVSISHDDTQTGMCVKFDCKEELLDFSDDIINRSASIQFNVKKPGKVDFKVAAYGIDLEGNRVDLDVEFENVITEIKVKYDASECQQGDVNCDGTVTASDARSALRISAGLDTPVDDIRALADFDSNGKVTAADARKILRIAAGLS